MSKTHTITIEVTERVEKLLTAMCESGFYGESLPAVVKRIVESGLENRFAGNAFRWYGSEDKWKYEPHDR